MSPVRGVSLLLLVVSCAAPPETAEPWPEAPADEAVGTLDGQPVTYGDVGRFLRSRDPVAFFRSLDALVLERVTRSEAKRLGIAAPPALLSRKTNRKMREWEARVRQAARDQTGEALDPALWLQRTTGMSLADWRGHVQRHAETELLQDLLLRYEMLTSRRIMVSLLVVEGRERGRRLAREARGGKDFPALAKTHAAETRTPGFPLLEPDVSDARIRESLFNAAPGAVVGPFAAGDSHYQVYRVDRIEKPRTGRYADLEREVQRDLVKRPVPVGEYERWRRRILLRHGFAAAGTGDTG